MSSPLNIQLASYEGPLDLLLDLIRKSQVNIYDIPIAQITAQYLSFLEGAAALDIEVGSEFVYMAATLIQIKSKMLLPKDPELQQLTGDEEDPRKELVERLLEHERYKSAAEMLQQKRLLEEAAWSNPQIRQFLTEEEVLSPGLDVSLFDLVKTFQTILERAKNRPTYNINSEEVTVPEMIRFVRSTLEKARGESVSVTRLFEAQGSRRAMLCLFLALLELVKRQAVALQQAEAFGDISIRASEGFDQALGSDQAIAAVEQEYN